MTSQRTNHAHLLRAIAAMWWVFLSVGVLVPLLPQYVRDGLGEPASAVGITILVFAVAGVAARPFAGLYLRSRDPWPLMAWAGAAAAVAVAATPIVHAWWWLLWLRFAEGIAVGLFYTAAATSVVKGTPSDRRGSALSYFSVPLFLGVAVGPMLGDALIAALHHDGTWLLAGGLMAVAVPFCLRAPRLREGRIHPFSRPNPPAGADPLVLPLGVARAGGQLPRVGRNDLLRTLAHPSAVWPAIVMALIVSGWASFQAYVPLYGPTLGMPATGTVFLTYSVVVLAIRIGGARLFDALPMVELVVVGAVANVLGLVVVWAWRDALALYGAAVLMAVAIGVAYTTLMRVALAGVPPQEEGTVVGAYSVAYDIGAGCGAALMGWIATITNSYTSVFAGGAVAGAIALAVALTRLWPRRHNYLIQQQPI